jgi:hypothetical protein
MPWCITEPPPLHCIISDLQLGHHMRHASRVMRHLIIVTVGIL